MVFRPGLPGVQVHRARASRSSGAARNRFSDWLWSMYGAARGGHVDQRPLRQLPRRAEQRRARPRAARSMPCTEPSAALDRLAHLGGPQAARLQLAHEGGVDLEELARQRLALEQVGHLRLDALVAAGDRGDRRRRRDRDQQRVAQPVLGDPRPQRGPPLGLGRASTPQRSGCRSPARPRGSRRTPGAGRARSASSARGLQRGQVDLLGDPGRQLRAPRRSRTAAAARRTRPAGPSRPSPTGRQRGLRRRRLRRSGSS